MRRSLAVVLGEIAYHAEGVVDEMRLNLSSKHREFAFHQFDLLFGGFITDSAHIDGRKIDVVFKYAKSRYNVCSIACGVHQFKACNGQGLHEDQHNYYALLYALLAEEKYRMYKQQQDIYELADIHRIVQIYRSDSALPVVIMVNIECDLAAEKGC